MTATTDNRELRAKLREIHDYAHDSSTGPEVPDAMWEVRGMAADALALLARTEAGAVDRISIKLTTDRKEGEPEGAEWWTWKREQLEAEGWVMESECADGAELFVRPKDAAPVADGAVAFRWKSGGTANKPRWVYAEAGSKSIPPVGAHPLFTHPQDASGDAEEVICEHSGCGHGPQANQVPVTLWPGDKVLMRRGRLGAAMQAKEAK